MCNAVSGSLEKLEQCHLLVKDLMVCEVTSNSAGNRSPIFSSKI